MKTLLDDLLDFSRASLGLGLGIHREQVDLAVVCAEEVDLLKAAGVGTAIEFHAQGDASGNFDGSRVREVLANLVTNAARYGTPGAAIEVTLIGDAEHVRLSVSNSGLPIPDETIHDLFEPLRRGRPLDERSDRANLGLGLFIVREIARAHGGEVQVVSAADKTVLSMVLPHTAGGLQA